MNVAGVPSSPFSSFLLSACRPQVAYACRLPAVLFSSLCFRVLVVVVVRRRTCGLRLPLVQCLRDTSLPVQIEAAASLRYLIELDEAEEPVLRVLPDVLNEYFRIMQEIGLDEVNSSCCMPLLIAPHVLSFWLFLSILCFFCSFHEKSGQRLCHYSGRELW